MREFVTQTLLTHVRAHANELGLAELGATAMQAAPRSLRDTSGAFKWQALYRGSTVHDSHFNLRAVCLE